MVKFFKKIQKIKKHKLLLKSQKDDSSSEIISEPSGTKPEGFQKPGLKIPGVRTDGSFKVKVGITLGGPKKQEEGSIIEPDIKKVLVKPKEEEEKPFSFFSWYRFYFYSKIFTEIKDEFFPKNSIKKSPEEKSLIFPTLKEKESKITPFDLGFFFQKDFFKSRLLFDKVLKPFDLGFLTQGFDVVFPGKTTPKPIFIPVYSRLQQGRSRRGGQSFSRYLSNWLRGLQRSVDLTRIGIPPSPTPAVRTPVFFFAGIYCIFYRLPNGLYTCYIGLTGGLPYSGTIAERLSEHAINARDGLNTLLQQSMPNSNPPVEIGTAANLMSLSFDEILHLLDTTTLPSSNTGFWFSVISIMDRLLSPLHNHEVVRQVDLRVYTQQATRAELQAAEFAYISEFILNSQLNGQSFYDISGGFVDGPVILITEVPMILGYHAINLDMFRELISLNPQDVARLDQDSLERLYRDEQEVFPVQELFY